MRTDRWIGRGVVAALLLLAGAAPTRAQAPATDAAGDAAAVARRDIFQGDRTVEAGQTVPELVVVGGDLRVKGTVRGDAVVVGGDLVLEPGGLVQGDAVVTGGEIVSHGGHVRGEVRVVGGGGASTVVHVDGVRHVRHDAIAHGHSPLDRIGRGLAGLAATIALGLVLAGLGAVLVFYGRPYLETVSDTLRGSMLRSGATGLAAGFLVLPALVVAIVALAVSVIGIPLLIAFVPLYPLAVAAALAFGLVAAAHAIGERTAEQRRKAFDLRYRNSYAYLFSGLGMLIAPLMAAHLIGMVGFLSVIGTLLKVVTWAVIWVVATFGFGAVILSRAGTRRTFVAPPPPDLGFEGEPFFDPAASGEPHA